MLERDLIRQTRRQTFEEAAALIEDRGNRLKVHAVDVRRTAEFLRAQAKAA